ncbi:MAG: iron ABC transporter permease [Thermoplasmatales archaeon]|nr:iron ABC transporter permease [Thermoplasmatales archaeon]
MNAPPGEPVPREEAAPPRRWGPLPLRVLVPAIVVGLFALLVGSTALGSVPIPAATTISIFFHQLTGGFVPSVACPGSVASHQCAIWTEIVWQARVPSLVLALAAGAALAISGGSLQGIFRNPLADPFLLGLSSGAALGAAAIFVLDVDPAHQAALLPLAAFLGGIIPGAVIYLAATLSRRGPTVLILSGVALSTFFSAILSAMLLYNPSSDVSLNFWLLGSLGATSWSDDGLVVGVTLVLGTVLYLRAREINLLQLGPEVAQSLGVRPQRTIQWTVLLTTAITATAVAFTGIIGFVGLIAPHLVRRLAGVDYRIVLPLGALMGGIVLLVAWDVAVAAIPPIVIPVGIPTAFIGAPFLIYLLYRRRAPGGSALDA